MTNKDEMPREIWAWELNLSYDVLDLTSYETTTKNEVSNGFHKEKEQGTTHYIRADIHEAQIKTLRDALVKITVTCPYDYSNNPVDCVSVLQDVAQQALEQTKGTE